jgi:hypothetical protein
MYVSMKDDPTIKRPRTVGGGPQGHGAALGMAGAGPQAGFPGRVALPYPGGRIPGGGLEVDNPPCNTLFVGNLGEGVDEVEVQELFALSPASTQCMHTHSQTLHMCHLIRIRSCMHQTHTYTHTRARRGSHSRMLPNPSPLSLTGVQAS